jgi:hypothetical protein
MKKREMFSMVVLVLSLILNNAYGNHPNDGLNVNKVRNSAEIFLKESLNDPGSYQFVSLNINDQVFTQRSNLEYRIESLSNREDANYAEAVIKVKQLLEDLGTEANNVACYVYNFRFRANNAMGGLVLTNSWLYISSDYKVIHIATTSGQMLEGTCNELPEYRKIIQETVIDRM